MNIPTPEEFSQYCDSLEQMIEESSKHELAKCAEALALELARYTLQHGPLEEPVEQAQLAPWLIQGAYHMGNMLSGVRKKNIEKQRFADALKHSH